MSANDEEYLSCWGAYFQSTKLNLNEKKQILVFLRTIRKIAKKLECFSEQLERQCMWQCQNMVSEGNFATASEEEAEVKNFGCILPGWGQCPDCAL